MIRGKAQWAARQHYLGEEFWHTSHSFLALPEMPVYKDMIDIIHLALEQVNKVCYEDVQRWKIRQ